MRNIASVIAIQEKYITVIPIISDTCIGCEQRNCGEAGEPFFVTNPKNFSLSIGSKVKIHASKKDQLAQAIFAIFLPIGAAILGFFMFGKWAENLDIQKIEAFKTLGSIAFLFFTSFLIIIKNRFIPPKGQSEISQVL